MIEWHKKVTKKIMKLIGVSQYRYMRLPLGKVLLLA